jgi:hypothetical protein
MRLHGGLVTDAVEDIARTLYGGKVDTYINFLDLSPAEVAAHARREVERLRDEAG